MASSYSSFSKLRVGDDLDLVLFFVQELTFVPLYGDMQMMPYQYISKTPNFDPSKWPCCESSAPSPQSNMMPSLGAIREDHMQFISQLARLNNEVYVKVKLTVIMNSWPLSQHFEESQVYPGTHCSRCCTGQWQPKLVLVPLFDFYTLVLQISELIW